MLNQPPSLPDGERIYAIGDVHGCLSLLGDLVGRINRECERDGVVARMIFLGDYIDRSIKSRETLDYLIKLKSKEKKEPVFLLGNHEKVMRDIVLHRDDTALKSWLSYGGRETLLSYGVSLSRTEWHPQEIIRAFAERVPLDHIQFLKNLLPKIEMGDYFFCHAGVRPEVDLAQQSLRDLIWIRDEFLTHTQSFGKIIVHGHTISPEAEFRSNRIGIDTGAFASGRLTALGLEGCKQWILQT